MQMARGSLLVLVVLLRGAATLPHAGSSQAAAVSRRAALIGLSGLLPAAPARAIFESPLQLALLQIATAQPKLRGLISEVAEVKRKRIKMAADAEDDAYVFRFARSVLDPQVKSMQNAASALPAGVVAGLVSDYQQQLAALDAGCRANDAGNELDALVAAEKALSEFLDLAAKAKYDVRPCEDINGYEGSTGILYNKFLFRSG